MGAFDKECPRCSSTSSSGSTNVPQPRVIQTPAVLSPTTQRTNTLTALIGGGIIGALVVAALSFIVFNRSRPPTVSPADAPVPVSTPFPAAAPPSKPVALPSRTDTGPTILPSPSATTVPSPTTRLPSAPTTLTKSASGPRVTDAEDNYCNAYVQWYKSIESVLAKPDGEAISRQDYMLLFARVDQIWSEHLTLYCPPTFASADSLLADALMTLRQAKIDFQFEAFSETGEKIEQGMDSYAQSMNEMADAIKKIREDPARYR